MTGPSDEAIEAARLEQGRILPYTDAPALVRAAYPIIIADVIAEVVAKLHDWQSSGLCKWMDAADYIERELGVRPND
jgi:hypothetical protein